MLYSMPEGWLGMLLSDPFAGMLGWFPAGGIESADRLTGFAHVRRRREASVPPLS